MLYLCLFLAKHQLLSASQCQPKVMLASAGYSFSNVVLVVAFCLKLQLQCCSLIKIDFRKYLSIYDVTDYLLLKYLGWKGWKGVVCRLTLAIRCLILIRKLTDFVLSYIGLKNNSQLIKIGADEVLRNMLTLYVRSRKLYKMQCCLLASVSMI